MLRALGMLGMLMLGIALHGAGANGWQTAMGVVGVVIYVAAASAYEKEHPS